MRGLRSFIKEVWARFCVVVSVVVCLGVSYPLMASDVMRAVPVPPEQGGFTGSPEGQPQHNDVNFFDFLVFLGLLSDVGGIDCVVGAPNCPAAEPAEEEEDFSEESVYLIGQSGDAPPRRYEYDDLVTPEGKPAVKPDIKPTKTTSGKKVEKPKKPLSVNLPQGFTARISEGGKKVTIFKPKKAGGEAIVSHLITSDGKLKRTDITPLSDKDRLKGGVAVRVRGGKVERFDKDSTPDPFDNPLEPGNLIVISGLGKSQQQVKPERVDARHPAGSGLMIGADGTVTPVTDSQMKDFNLKEGQAAIVGRDEKTKQWKLKTFNQSEKPLKKHTLKPGQTLIIAPTGETMAKQAKTSVKQFAPGHLPLPKKETKIERTPTGKREITMITTHKDGSRTVRYEDGSRKTVPPPAKLLDNIIPTLKEGENKVLLSWVRENEKRFFERTKMKRQLTDAYVSENPEKNIAEWAKGEVNNWGFDLGLSPEGYEKIPLKTRIKIYDMIHHPGANFREATTLRKIDALEQLLLGKIRKLPLKTKQEKRVAEDLVDRVQNACSSRRKRLQHTK